MVTHIGDQRLYDNLSVGFAKNEGDDDSVFAVFTDNDNEVIHMFPIAHSKFEQWVSLGRQTMAGQKIEIAGPGDMPRAAS